VASSGDRGSVSYALGAWLGQVTWSPATGSRTQYRWRATVTATQMHAMGLPAAIHPRAPLPVDVLVTSAGGSWSGTAQAAGGVFRFSAVPLAGGRRRVTATGSADGAALANLGLSPPGMISGPTGLTAILDLEPAGLRTAHVTADLQRAVVSPPFTSWRKPAGRAMRLSADISRHDGMIEATALKGDGPGFALDAAGAWRPASDGVLRVTRAKLEGAFDGALELAFQPEGQSLTVQGRYFDARKMIQAGGKASSAPGGPTALTRPLRFDAQLAQVRVTDQGMVRNVRLVGGVGGAERQKVELTVNRDDGSALIDLRLIQDAGGMAVNGQVTDVGQAALALFGKHSFRGGQASVTGRLVQGGADLHVEMTKVRLIQAPGIARILTVGSLHGMADMLNGSGIEFTKVVAPVSIRGSKLNIGHARATGPAMGVTTQGVIDFDTQTVDLSGGIAPSYVLNSAMGSAPIIGNIFVSRKGEGMFGLTYSAKGAFNAPKLNVNPLSIAAPGILRRLFEGHSAAEKLPAAEGG
jgi:hypothetical protein